MRPLDRSCDHHYYYHLRAFHVHRGDFPGEYPDQILDLMTSHLVRCPDHRDRLAFVNTMNRIIREAGACSDLAGTSPAYALRLARLTQDLDEEIGSRAAGEADGIDIRVSDPTYPW